MSGARVLFVCLHGAAKSVLAAADFERMGRERGLRVIATCAGTEPDAAVAPAVAAVLRAEGVDLDGSTPRLVTREDVAAADRVIAFGCALGAAAPSGAAIEQWDDIPAVSDDLPAARAAIRRRLERLLAEYEGAPRARKEA